MRLVYALFIIFLGPSWAIANSAPQTISSKTFEASSIRLGLDANVLSFPRGQLMGSGGRLEMEAFLSRRWSVLASGALLMDVQALPQFLGTRISGFFNFYISGSQPYKNRVIVDGIDLGFFNSTEASWQIFGGLDQYLLSSSVAVVPSPGMTLGISREIYLGDRGWRFCLSAGITSTSQQTGSTGVASVLTRL